MQDYEHHIFVSYRRSDEDWIRWTHNNFVRALKALLRPCLGNVKIYIDECIETGAFWPHHLALNLARSRLMVPILSRDYFQSQWCRLELALMYHREQITNFRTLKNPNGLIIPVVIDDGECFPKEIQAMQWEPLHKFANPFIRIDSPKQEQLAEVIKSKICPTIEKALTNTPPFDPSWEKVSCDEFMNMFEIAKQSQKTVPSLRLPY